jgi:hypothetical protein
MPGKNKTPLLGWHPPAELSAWVRDEAERRGVTLAVILNEALSEYQASREPAAAARAELKWENYVDEFGYG